MHSRIPLIAGNWKMHKSLSESVDFATKLLPLVSDTSIEIMIAPPFTALHAVAEKIKGSKIYLGAQDVFWEKEGAYTGEISPWMLTDIGCSHVIIGHSERRQYLGETDITVNQKIKAALHAGLIPIFCIGETESQREAGDTFSVLDKQIQKGLEGLTFDPDRMLIVAYEPVWAIGTGKTALPQQVQEAHGHVRKRLSEIAGAATATAVRILYGGSVKPDNISQLMALPDVDGALVGGASLNVDTFAKIIHFN